MSDKNNFLGIPKDNILNVHFDTNEHYLPIENFIISSQSSVKLINNLTNQFFGNNLSYQVVVLPPESGTFLKKIGIIATVVGGVSVAPIAQEYFLGVFKEIAKHEPSYYGANHARAIIDLAKGFMQTEVDDLEKIITPEINLDRAFKAKSDFYSMCSKNQNIMGIGFDDTKDFPIKRKNFPSHISKERVRDVPSDLTIYNAIIISPVDVDIKSQWKIRDKVSNVSVSAYMKDEDFKTNFLRGNYPLKQSNLDDEIVVLIESKKQEINGEIKEKEKCINEVYSFNGKQIKPIPLNLKVFDVTKKETAQGELFLTSHDDRRK